MKRKKNKRFYIMVFLVISILLIFLAQKVFAPKWKNGNTNVTMKDERGVHEQYNEQEETGLPVFGMVINERI